ncbi:sugar transferase [Prosthecobacter sp.]|uniref:sugar transferase n=1 Tax=Prosthecobacter sp. TaxID=1965333 RepID=UPI0037837C8F
MDVFIICPDYRKSAGFARRIRPLALLPVLGRTLLDLWLEHLAAAGVTHATILAADRPHEVRAAVDQGGRWGLTVTVLSVKREPSIEETRLRFTGRDTSGRVPNIITLDTLPDMPHRPLWESSAALFDIMLDTLRGTPPESHLTMREIAPEVHVSTRAQVASTAMIEGPVWIGPQVIIGEHAQIRAGTIIEDAAYIDRHAIVSESWVGPSTYVGALTNVQTSFAWGGGIENWKKAAFLEVTDDFLLTNLNHKPFGGVRSGWFTRITALLLMVLTSPLAMLYALWTRLTRWQSALESRQVVLPPPNKQDRFSPSTRLYTLVSAPGFFSRWPELWAVWRGDMHLVGNRPLSQARAALLTNEFERMWFDAPAGIFSYADIMNDGMPGDNDTAHSACYAIHRCMRLNLRILMYCLPRFLLPVFRKEQDIPSNSHTQTCH